MYFVILAINVTECQTTACHRPFSEWPSIVPSQRWPPIIWHSVWALRDPCPIWITLHTCLSIMESIQCVWRFDHRIKTFSSTVLSNSTRNFSKELAMQRMLAVYSTLDADCFFFNIVWFWWGWYGLMSCQCNFCPECCGSWDCMCHLTSSTSAASYKIGLQKPTMPLLFLMPYFLEWMPGCSFSSENFDSSFNPRLD